MRSAARPCVRVVQSLSSCSRPHPHQSKHVVCVPMPDVDQIFCRVCRPDSLHSFSFSSATPQAQTQFFEPARATAWTHTMQWQAPTDEDEFDAHVYTSRAVTPVGLTSSRRASTVSQRQGHTLTNDAEVDGGFDGVQPITTDVTGVPVYTVDGASPRSYSIACPA